MPLSQSKEATKEFVSFLESHLITIHPGYQRNQQVKGIRYEYFRELEDDLFSIHSVICIRGTYHHCFCLSVHRTHTFPQLYSPFTIGGRCDHNYTITRACHRDLGLSPIDPVAPFRMSDSHKFRKGADRIILRCTSEAEVRLLPFYHSVWSKTRPSLQALLDFAATTPPDQLASYAAACSIPPHELSCHMLEYRRHHDSLSASQRPSFYAAVTTTIPDTVFGTHLK